MGVKVNDADRAPMINRRPESGKGGGMISSECDDTWDICDLGGIGGAT